jgi:hypothetical protein
MKDKKATFEMGTAFWTNPQHPTLPSHLHIVISDPAKNPGEIAVVNVTTVRGDDYDASCVLEPGDHYTIRHKSYVGYRRGWVVNLNALKALFDAGQIHRAKPGLEPEVVKRVQTGAMASKWTPARIKGLLAEQGLT